MERKFYTNNEGQTVGDLFEGVYSKRVQSSKHFMRRMNGYAIETSILDDLSKMGCKEIRIFETESETIYSVSFQTFMDKSVAIDYVSPQRCLSIGEFAIGR
mgnify:FL=1